MEEMDEAKKRMRTMRTSEDDVLPACILCSLLF